MLDIKGERFLLFLVKSNFLLFFYFKYFFWPFIVYMLFITVLKIYSYFFELYVFILSHTISFSYNFLPYRYSIPYRFSIVEFFKNISLFFYNFVSYLINGTIFSFFFISTTLFIFFEVFIVFLWSILNFVKLFLQKTYYDISYHVFLSGFGFYYIFYIFVSSLGYFLAFILFFIMTFWLFNSDFISDYVNFAYYSGRFSQSFNTFAQTKMLPMDHHFSLWWLIRIYLIYLFLFFVNISTRKYIIQHGFIIVFIPLLISFTSYRMFITKWLTYLLTPQIGQGYAERKFKKLYGLSRYSQLNETFRGSKYQNLNQEFFRPFLRPILRQSNLAQTGPNIFRVTDNRTGSDLRRFYDINIASEIDSYKYDQLRMEQLKAVFFFLEEEEFQKEVKRTIHEHQIDPYEVIPETGERPVIDPAVKLRSRPFSGIYLPAPAPYEHIEPRLPPDITPIIDFENISSRDSDEDIKYIFVPMADQKRKEWWEYDDVDIIKDGEPLLTRLSDDKRRLTEMLIKKFAIELEQESKLDENMEESDNESNNDEDNTENEGEGSKEK